MSSRTFLMILSWVCAMETAFGAQTRDVRTRSGVVRGYRKGLYYAFLGIPYARPMVGTERFKAPEPPRPWSNVLKANRNIRCPQHQQDARKCVTGGEHCLVVNVMVSVNDYVSDRPVLLIVHGGDFATGWGAYSPPEGFIEDFVVVTFNYRLGALGFLCLGTEEASGNAGLKDQVAAIYWIHRNIESFGGNPEDVTLYGVGSGAASIQLLLLSGLVKGLVHRAIVESGSLLSPVMMSYTPYDTAHKAAISLKYVASNAKDLTNYYKNLPLNKLLNITATFLPCVENTFYHSYTFLDKDPIDILSSGNFDKVPLLVALTNAQEVDLIKKAPDLFKAVPEYFEDILPHNLVFDSNFTRHRVGDVIKAYYFGDHPKELSKEALLDNYIEYINDIFMEYPVVKFAMLYASKSVQPVYMMRYSFGDASFGDPYNILMGKIKDKAIAEKLVTLWRNFITINDPTPLTTSLVPLIWQPIEATDDRHQLPITKASWLVLGTTVSMSEESSNQRLSFWDRIYDKFYKIHVFDRIDL